jgi:hypothetical protein
VKIYEPSCYESQPTWIRLNTGEDILQLSMHSEALEEGLAESWQSHIANKREKPPNIMNVE